MTVYLDHTIVASRDKVVSARLLAELLGVEWAAFGIGPFAPVCVNAGLTLDFIDTDEAFPVYIPAFVSRKRTLTQFWVASRRRASRLGARSAVQRTCRSTGTLGVEASTGTN